MSIRCPFASFPGPLYQNKVKCSALDTRMISHSHANKTLFSQEMGTAGID